MMENGQQNLTCAAKTRAEAVSPDSSGSASKLAVGNGPTGALLRLQGKPVTDGIGAHASAHLAFFVPPRRAKFPPRCPPTARASIASGPPVSRRSVSGGDRNLRWLGSFPFHFVRFTQRDFEMIHFS
jgi:hypothetical protein